MSKLTLVALLGLLAIPAFAAGCSGIADLTGGHPHPQVYMVAGPGLLALSAAASAIDGCPPRR